MLIERLKMGLTSRATGGGMDPQEYKRIRRLLLASPLADRLPRFLKTCHSPEEFWGYIQPVSPTYQGRRTHIAEQLNHLLDGLDTAALETLHLYEKGPRLGAGGFGEVWRYDHKLLGMPFAFKVFNPVFNEAGDSSIDRFFREAKILFSLQHADIIRIYDVGMLGRRPFIRMEFFDGLNLGEAISKHGVFTPKKAARVVHRLADALAHAHAKNVVHRDLKPSNVMVAQGEKLRVIDFGLGVYVDDMLQSRITRTGEAVAGGAFTAPELLTQPQLRDPRTDVYSIGAIWYYLLTGRPPAGPRALDLLQAHVDAAAHHDIISRCLDLPDDRVESAAVLAQRALEFAS